jgi:hypothetical protein
MSDRSDVFAARVRQGHQALRHETQQAHQTELRHPTTNR